MSFSFAFTLVLLPEVLLQSLHPLEVRDDDASRVDENVRKDQHPQLVENLVRGGVRGPLAPSATMRARTLPAFSSLTTCSSAHGASTSQSYSIAPGS